MLKFRHTLKANRMYAAYKYDNSLLKQRCIKDFISVPDEDKIEIVAFAFKQLVKKGEHEGAEALFNQYRDILIRKNKGSFVDLMKKFKT